MGSPWYAVQTSAEQEAVAELVPETHPGPLRLSDWDELQIGTYDAGGYALAPTAALHDLLEEFDHELSRIPKDGRMDHEGIMVIEDWQTGLKKITLRVLWTNAEDGSTGEYSQTVYLHEDSNYGQGE